jgi:phosphoribosylglycinamide formyltransferase 2
MSVLALLKAQDIVKKVTDALGGYGVFSVELFIKGDNVYFNEVSPRPHDMGIVTLISQNINEFELHLKTILGLPGLPYSEDRAYSTISFSSDLIRRQ